MTWMGAAVRNAFGVAWRHRWTYAVPVATLLLPATLYAVRLPDLYRARAVVIVRPLENGAAGGLPQERAAQTYELVQTSRDRLLTYSNAGHVVPILYPGHASNDPWALEAVRGRILWDRAGDSAFAVSLEDQSPKVAADAVNGMLKAFQENEKRLKLDAAEGLQRQYEAQLAGDQAKSQEAHARLDGFRAENAEVLPELESTINNEIGRLLSEVGSQKQAASSARARAQFLGEQITRWSATSVETTPARRTSAEEDKLKAQLDQQQKATDETRKELIKERTDHTDKHPNVKKLERQLEMLEADVKATVAALDAARKSAFAASSKEHQQQARTVVDDMKAMRAETEKEEQRFLASAKDLELRLAALGDRLSRIPGMRPRFQTLQRDVDTIQRTVEQSEGRVASARAVADYLRSSSPNEVTGYRLDDWAVPPVLPSGPARWKYLAVAVGLGLVIGYGARSLRKRYEQPPLAEPQELRELLPGALVVTVPLLAEGLRPKKGLPFREFALGLWVMVAIGTSALALAARKGIVTPPEWLRPIVGGRA